MAYFNHAFTKMFVGIQVSGSGAGQNPNSNLTNGFVTTAGIPSLALAAETGSANQVYGPGSYGFFDQNYNSLTTGTLGTGCCPIYLVSASLLTNDKIGPFHGGYKESNKSKMINPKYVQAAYRVDPCIPQQAVVDIGSTPYTTSSTLTVGSLVGGTGFTTGTYYNVPLLTVAYATGTIAITGNTVTGTGTTFTANMVGDAFYVPSLGIDAIITGYTSATVITISASETVAPGTAYHIQPSGTGAQATVIVSGGGVVTSVSITSSGDGYNVGTLLQVDPAVLPSTTISTVTVATIGTKDANCCYSFLCGETYYLRIDIKGSPALRAFNHNVYQNIEAYTGCCPSTSPVPVAVDPTTVYITWASAIIINPYMTSYVMPVVFDYTGVAWYAPGTTVTLDGTNTVVTPAQWWTNYPASTQAAAWVSTLTNACSAGMRLYGAFVETKFGNCSFQVIDFFEKEPIKVYASLVDYNGDPCTFEGLCVYQECIGVQGMGYGEQVVRDLILAESYLTNFFHSDIRIREITQGDQILNSINRNAFYTRYYILHSVPRFNNPTGVFDNDRYMLEIISTGANPVLETFLTTWLGNCANCVPFTINDCNQCSIVPDASTI